MKFDGKKLYNYRIEKEYSAVFLGQLVGVTDKTILNYESGVYAKLKTSQKRSTL